MTRNFKTYFVSTIIFLTSCSTPADKQTKSDMPVDTIKSTDNVVQADSLPKIQTDEGPSTLLFDMVHYLDSIGFVNDTMVENKLWYSDKCFFKITLSKHEIFNLSKYGYRQGAFDVDTATIQKRLFYKVKNIYGYAYKIKQRSEGINPDGVIEEWQFDNESDAEKAGIEFNRIKNVVHWFTVSYITRSKSNVYAFHNRATFHRFHNMTIDRYKQRFDKIYDDLKK